MSGSSIVIPPDLGQLINDREKVWADIERSQNLSAELGKLAASVPQCAPARLQLQFGANSTPTTELETVLPLLKEKIETAQKLNAEVQACYDQIEAIKHQEKMIIIGAIIAGIVVLFILIIVVVNLVS